MYKWPIINTIKRCISEGSSTSLNIPAPCISLLTAQHLGAGFPRICKNGQLMTTCWPLSKKSSKILGFSSAAMN